MSRRYIFKFLVIAVLLLSTQCTKDIEYRGPDLEPMLVVNAVARPGEQLMVAVSHSTFFLDDSEPERISDASVSVSINGESRDAVYDADTLAYIDSRIVCVGDEIALNVSHPRYGQATSSVRVSPEAKFRTDWSIAPYVPEYKDDIFADEDYLSSELDYDLYSEPDSVLVMDVAVELPDEECYYRLTVNPIMTFVVGSGFFSTDYEYDISWSLSRTFALGIGLIDLSDSFTYEGVKSFVFSGESLRQASDTNIRLSFQMAYPLSPLYWALMMAGLIDEEQNVTAEDLLKLIDGDCKLIVEVSLERITPEYYRYIQSSVSYMESDFAFSSFFSEPVQISSNIQGGLGILGARSGRVEEIIYSYSPGGK